MKRNGFTLVELLAVITILSLLALITTTLISNTIKDSKEELSDTQMKMIKAASQSWASDNINSLPSKNNECSYLTLKDLINDGFLESTITDPKSKQPISDTLVIKIVSKENSSGKVYLTYEVNPTDIGSCVYMGSSVFVDVPEGLTPVIYDGENWKVPEANEEWYNYDEQKWANAVVLGKGKTKKPGEIVTVEGDNPDALMMLVYIPRYEYKIEGEYGTHANGIPGTAELPGEIEVKFTNNSKLIADDGYILHPAFTFGDKELNGIWVGKFELSSKSENAKENNNLGCNQSGCTGDISNLRILPNVEALRYNDISNFFYGIRKIEETTSFGLSNMDTHMMKNSEWGAVAYLSQSKYGKYGNNDYKEANREIYQNKSNEYKTGSSNGTISQRNTYTQCKYNQEKGTNENQDQKNCGMGASTTGNIYGVYDMSGGAIETVMGAYGPEYPTIDSSGFESTVFTGNTIESKYYDLYKTSTANTACNNNEICYGHGLSETSNWYGDNSIGMVNTSNPWIDRGGVYNNDNTGAFYFWHTSGNIANNSSTRVVALLK